MMEVNDMKTTLCLGLKFMENLDLPKDYRLIRDLLPPNIC